MGPERSWPLKKEATNQESVGNMATSILNATLAAFASEVPAIVSRVKSLQAVYEEHQSRIYNLAFYLTENELTAEDVTARVFTNVFSVNRTPSAETLDRALVNELRETLDLGTFTLAVPETTEVAGARKHVKRTSLEYAVMLVPATERMIFMLHDVEGYDHSRIARILGISTGECVKGLHQARLAVRGALAQINS
jgi:RNA polymerase sigma-70 factor (ECF subfamily)